MNALVSDFAVSVIPEKAPVVMEPVRVEPSSRGGTKPLVVIDPSGRVGVCRSADADPHLINPRLHEADLAEFAGCGVFHCASVMRSAASLRADLNDAVVFARGVADNAAFFDGLTKGLLKIDVLTSGDRKQTHACVPVVRCRNQDRIDLFVVEDPSEILHILRLPFLVFRDNGPSLMKDFVVKIAKGLD